MARQLIVLALILVALVGLVLADEELIIATAATPEAPSGATAATPEGAENPAGTSVDLSSISTIPSNTPPSPTMAAGESSADEAATPVSAPPKEERKSESNDAATLKVSAAAGVAAVAGLFFF